jgi:hypothetical protein
MPSPATSALIDQLTAAAKETYGRLRTVANAYGELSKPSDWEIQQLVSVQLDLMAHNLSYCQHLNQGPRPMWAASWAPGRAVCTTCIRQLMPSESEDYTCDKCRRVCETLAPSAICAGPLTVAYGLCRTCLAEGKASE